MKKTFFASQVIQKGEYDNDYQFTLEYYLLTGNIKQAGSGNYTDCYGIEIVKKFKDLSGNELTQKSTAKNITTDKLSAYTLLRTIYNQKITPVCLHEVIDDCYQDKLFQYMQA